MKVIDRKQMTDILERLAEYMESLKKHTPTVEDEILKNKIEFQGYDLDEVVYALKWAHHELDLPETSREIKEDEDLEKLIDDLEFLKNRLHEDDSIDALRFAIGAVKFQFRKSGEWEKTPEAGTLMTPGGDPQVRCPFCKSRKSYHINGVEHDGYNFCPNCGAMLK